MRGIKLYIYKLIYNEENTHNDVLVSLSRLAQTLKNSQVIKIINFSRILPSYTFMRIRELCNI